MQACRLLRTAVQSARCCNAVGRGQTLCYEASDGNAIANATQAESRLDLSETLASAPCCHCSIANSCPRFCGSVRLLVALSSPAPCRVTWDRSRDNGGCRPFTCCVMQGAKLVWVHAHRPSRVRNRMAGSASSVTKSPLRAKEFPGPGFWTGARERSATGER